MTGKSRPILLEMLEPRIMLSADSLLNVTVPINDQDTLPNGMQQLVQYAELPEKREEAEEQISQELAPPETPNIGDY